MPRDLPDLKDERLPRDAEATRFWWVRHAPVPEVSHQMYGNLDVDCDTSDAATFMAVARQLPTNAIWYTSHLKRTHQTANALVAAGANPAEQREDPDIGEMDFGVHTGKAHVDLLTARNDPFVGFFPVSPLEPVPQGESFTDLAVRVQRFLGRTRARHPGRDLVCVAHRGTILAALHLALDTPLHTSVAFVIRNVSITRIAYYPNVDYPGPKARVRVVDWLP